MRFYGSLCVSSFCPYEVDWPRVTPEGLLLLSVFHYSHSRMPPQYICTTNWTTSSSYAFPPLLPLLLSLGLLFDVPFHSPPFFYLIPALPLFFSLCFPFRAFCLGLSYLTPPPLSFLSIIPPAKPKNSANGVTVQAGTKSVVVARCEAADAKPAATIEWLAPVGGNHSTSTTSGPDGTVTVRSEYRLVPTPADNGREVICRVNQKTQKQPWVYPIKLSVECKEDTHIYSWTKHLELYSLKGYFISMITRPTKVLNNLKVHAIWDTDQCFSKNLEPLTFTVTCKCFATNWEALYTVSYYILEFTAGPHWWEQQGDKIAIEIKLTKQ